jgi:hypothetical protein
VARMEDAGGAYRFLLGRREGKRHLKDLGIGGGILLK